MLPDVPGGMTGSAGSMSAIQLYHNCLAVITLFSYRGPSSCHWLSVPCSLRMVGGDGLERFGSCALLATIPGDAREKAE